MEVLEGVGQHIAYAYRIIIKSVTVHIHVSLSNPGPFPLPKGLLGINFECWTPCLQIHGAKPDHAA